MSVQELQKYTSISKYARWLKDKRRRELWPETTGRYEQMLVDKYPGREEKIRQTCQAIEAREVMPSMRGLQFGGKPIFQHNARIYNCAGTYIDRLRAFPEAFYMLLCGSGVGFSVQHAHIQHLPRFSKKLLAGVVLPKKTFRPQDSIEGWADCHAVLLSATHEEPIRGFEEYHECEPVFDLSGIRAEGAELSFGIGKAPGPLPLRTSLVLNRDLIRKAISEGLIKFNSIFAFDYLMHQADAVISGGVRRSATLALFDVWDTLMTMAKTGNWLDANPQRGRANISALLVRENVTWEQFSNLFNATRQFGEPGFYWADDADSIANPCVEIGFWCKLAVDLMTEQGRQMLRSYQGPVYNLNGSPGSIADGEDRKVALSGWQMCNLSMVNGKTLAGNNKQERVKSFHERCEYASRIGTWQAGFNSFPYLGEVSEGIVRQEALIGVSIAGMMHYPDVFLDPDVLQSGAKIVIRTNEEEALSIGINPAARTTCEKPDGNGASALGCFSGAHPGKFRGDGFRMSQANRNEPVFQYFKSVNPHACEQSSWGKNDEVIRFCVNYQGLTEEDMTAVEFLENVKLIQQNWVKVGKVQHRCTKPGLSHNVSNTVRVRDNEWDDVAWQIFKNREHYSGVSLISWSGDKDYHQAPFTKVYLPEETEVAYGPAAVHSESTEQLLRNAYSFTNLWDACALALNHWDFTSRVPTEEQLAWTKQLIDFSEHYFKSDIKMATYLLKDIYNYRLWKDLKQKYVEVDYSQMVETTNNVNMQQEVACASGACEI